MYKRVSCYACGFLFCFFSLHKAVRPAETDKAANLAQHPERLGTAGSYNLCAENETTSQSSINPRSN